MKKLILFITITLSISAQALTKQTSVVFDASGKPVKVYSNVEDCINFCAKNQQYSNQQVNIYYTPDSTSYEPSAAVLQEEITNPTPLQDKYLAQKKVYVVLQRNFASLADRVYMNITEGKSYIDNFKLTVVELPYFYRDKNSYDNLYKQKRAKLKKR